jgi:chemotaxis protein CheD
MNIVIGVADMKTSADPEATLVTYALGSCIGVTLYDPVAKVGGLLHFMLPESQIDLEKSLKMPAMFADTGLPILFREAYKLGAEKQRIRVKIAGGSQILDNSNFFNIGRRNYLTLRKILWANQILIKGEDVGGQQNRTLRLEIATGKVWVKTSGDGEKEL